MPPPPKGGLRFTLTFLAAAAADPTQAMTVDEQGQRAR